MNYYRYVRNDPTTLLDPVGLCTLCSKRIRVAGEIATLDQDVKGSPYGDLTKKVPALLNGLPHRVEWHLQLGAPPIKLGLFHYESPQFNVGNRVLQEGTYEAAHVLVFFEWDVTDARDKKCNLTCKEDTLFLVPNLRSREAGSAGAQKMARAVAMNSRLVDLAHPKQGDATQRLLYMDVPGIAGPVKPETRGAAATAHVRETCQLSAVKNSMLTLDVTVRIYSDNWAEAGLNSFRDVSF